MLPCQRIFDFNKKLRNCQRFPVHFKNCQTGMAKNQIFVKKNMIFLEMFSLYSILTFSLLLLKKHTQEIKDIKNIKSKFF